MNIVKKTTLVLAISLTILTTAVAQNAQYEAGQKAMHSGNYYQAAQQFERAAKDVKYRQAAWYWQAYALYKTKQNAKAKGILKNLLRLYPKGNWAESAEVLLFENTTQEKREKEFKLNDELRLIAIEQLFFNNPEKGLPLVTELLKSSKNFETKKNALHLLGISNTPKASENLYEFILQEKNKELKNNAVQMLSLRNSKNSEKLLTKLYNNAQDKRLKSTIIQGFIHSDESNGILKMFDKEKDEELKNQMIQLLGVKGESEKLKQLKNKLNTLTAKKNFIQALAISGDSQAIKDFVTTSKDNKVKIAAINSFVMLEDIDGDYLVDLYKRMTDDKLKKTLISAFISNDIRPEYIVRLYKQEHNPAFKKRLLNVLRIIDANDELIELYKTETDTKIQKEIIQMLGINGRTYELADLYKQTQDFDNKKAILHAFAINDSSNNAEFLLETYKGAETEIKKIIIHSFFIQDNPEALLALLKTESDYDLKKQIIKTISHTDSDVILEKLLQEQ